MKRKPDSVVDGTNALAQDIPENSDSETNDTRTNEDQQGTLSIGDSLYVESNAKVCHRFLLNIL